MKIKFDIRFPKELSAEQRATLKSVLESAKY
jgi:DnaJ-class molecular chaperone